MAPTTPTPPTASAISTLIDRSSAKSASEFLAITILHNLQYQHEWTDLKLHLACPSHGPSAPNGAAAGGGLLDLDGNKFGGHSNPSSRSTSPSRSASPSRSGSFTLTGNGTTNPVGGTVTVPIISGLPPQHSYLHPDLQTYLIKHKIKESEIPVQKEFVLPLALGEKWSLARLCAVFDQLPEREVVRVRHPHGSAGAGYEHKDTKRLLCGMRAREGGGGDGAVVYYIMQEGEVKPRQNG